MFFYKEGSLYCTFLFLFCFIYGFLETGKVLFVQTSLLSLEACLKDCRGQGTILAHCRLLWAAAECSEMQALRRILRTQQIAWNVTSRFKDRRFLTLIRPTETHTRRKLYSKEGLEGWSSPDLSYPLNLIGILPLYGQAFGGTKRRGVEIFPTASLPLTGRMCLSLGW